jgi:hypothetical protein
MSFYIYAYAGLQVNIIYSILLLHMEGYVIILREIKDKFGIFKIWIFA